MHVQNGHFCKLQVMIAFYIIRSVQTSTIIRVTEPRYDDLPSVRLCVCQEAYAAYPRQNRAAVFHGPLDILDFLRSRILPITGSRSTLKTSSRSVFHDTQEAADYVVSGQFMNGASPAPRPPQRAEAEMKGSCYRMNEKSNTISSSLCSSRYSFASLQRPSSAR